MTEEEFEQAEDLRRQYADVGVMPEAVEIADALFADENAKGMIRLQEHAQIARVELLEISEFVKGYSDTVPEEGLGHIPIQTLHQNGLCRC